MIKISLYHLDNPVLIVKQKTGISYYNQTGGCGCYHNEQEGFLIPLPKVDPMENLWANYNLWYEKSIGYMNEPLVKILQEMHNDTKINKEAIWWDDVVSGIEAFDFGWHVISQIKVNRDVPQYEAWLDVIALIGIGDVRNEERIKKEAILTWQNCD